jgi:hypothetical protein
MGILSEIYDSGAIGVLASSPEGLCASRNRIKSNCL